MKYTRDTPRLHPHSLPAELEEHRPRWAGFRSPRSGLTLGVKGLSQCDGLLLSGGAGGVSGHARECDAGVPRPWPGLAWSLAWNALRSRLLLRGVLGGVSFASGSWPLGLSGVLLWASSPSWACFCPPFSCSSSQEKFNFCFSPLFSSLSPISAEELYHLGKKA